MINIADLDIDGAPFAYDLTEVAGALHVKHGTGSFNDVPVIIDIGIYRLYISQLYFNIYNTNDELRVTSFEGFLLAK
jgi:hypothetical protein